MSLADARIRRFSAFTWLAGSAAAIVVAFITMPFLGVNPNTGALVFDDPNEYEFRPWQDPDAAELEIEDGRIVGDARGGYIDLPAGSDLWELGPLARGDDRVSVYQQVDADVPVSDERPLYMSSMGADDTVVVVPGSRGSRIWFAPVLDDWAAGIAERSPAVIDGSAATGEGPALLSYRGDALSGRFTYSGEGFFRVDAVLPGSTVDLTRGIDEVDERASWPATDRVVFRIDADEGAWSLTLDEPASVSSSPSSRP